jgi:hypothetical protein
MRKISAVSALLLFSSTVLFAAALPVRKVTQTVNAATTNVLTVSCPVNTRVLGGGCADNFTSTLLRTSAPHNEGWLCIFEDSSIGGTPLSFSAYAFCLSGNPADVGFTHVSTTSVPASSNVEVSSCPPGKQIVGGGCNDFFTSTRLRTTAPDGDDWLCIFEDASINGTQLGFGADAFCVNQNLGVGLQTVTTTTFAATSNVQVATCPAGKRVLGGGCNDLFTSTRLRTSAPLDDTRWLCVFEDFQIGGTPLGFSAFAICGN